MSLEYLESTSQYTTIRFYCYQLQTWQSSRLYVTSHRMFMVYRISPESSKEGGRASETHLALNRAVSAIMRGNLEVNFFCQGREKQFVRSCANSLWQGAPRSEEAWQGGFGMKNGIKLALMQKIYPAIGHPRTLRIGLTLETFVHPSKRGMPCEDCAAVSKRGTIDFCLVI